MISRVREKRHRRPFCDRAHIISDPERCRVSARTMLKWKPHANREGPIPSASNIAVAFVPFEAQLSFVLLLEHHELVTPLVEAEVVIFHRNPPKL